MIDWTHHSTVGFPSRQCVTPHIVIAVARCEVLDTAGFAIALGRRIYAAVLSPSSSRVTASFTPYGEKLAYHHHVSPIDPTLALLRDVAIADSGDAMPPYAMYDLLCDVVPMLPDPRGPWEPIHPALISWDVPLEPRRSVARRSDAAISVLSLPIYESVRVLLRAHTPFDPAIVPLTDLLRVAVSYRATSETALRCMEYITNE